jgi:hypothetical protein
MRVSFTCGRASVLKDMVGAESREFCRENGYLPSFLEVAQFLPGSGPRECKIYRLVAPIPYCI